MQIPLMVKLPERLNKLKLTYFYMDCSLSNIQSISLEYISEFESMLGLKCLNNINNTLFV